MQNHINTLITGGMQDRRVRILLAISAITMFVLSAGAPGATGW